MYQNTTTQVGAFEFEGAVTSGNNTAANVDLSLLGLAPGAAGEQIGSLSVLGYNFSPDTVQADPTIYVWADNGTGGNPGTLLGEYSLGLQTMAAGASTDFTYTVPGGLSVPGDDQIWVGLGYSNDNGLSTITATDLNDLGGLTFGPATVGTALNPPAVDGAGVGAVFFPPTELGSLNNPTVYAFGAPGTAEYGWTVTATPEPGSFVLFATGLLALGSLILWRRQRV